MTKKRRISGAGRGVLPNGRSARTGPFIQLPWYVFDCPAHQSLKPGPRALLVELIRRHNGHNNGHIALGLREATAALNLKDKDTTARYFAELVERGLTAPTRRGGFNMKDPSSRRATEWRLTWLCCGDRPPTKEFLKWKP